VALDADQVETAIKHKSLDTMKFEHNEVWTQVTTGKGMKFYLFICAHGIFELFGPLIELTHHKPEIIVG
jgi:hypothetical protein